MSFGATKTTEQKESSYGVTILESEESKKQSCADHASNLFLDIYALKKKRDIELQDKVVTRCLETYKRCSSSKNEERYKSGNPMSKDLYYSAYGKKGTCTTIVRKANQEIFGEAAGEASKEAKHCADKAEDIHNNIGKFNEIYTKEITMDMSRLLIKIKSDCKENYNSCSEKMTVGGIKGLKIDQVGYMRLAFDKTKGYCPNIRK